MKEPRNEQGQSPTHEPDETVARLEEKRRQDRGAANKERIAEKEREVSGGR